jgi:hypothetical protein
MTKSETTLLITPQTIIYDLLNNYPELEDRLIEIAPIFIKLKNPVLRKTIAKITTLKQASVIADIQIAELINSLRKAAGQDTLPQEAEDHVIMTDGIPEWVLKAVPSLVYDAGKDLEKGVHPLPKVMGAITKLEEKEVYLLTTPFNPAPLIQKVKDKGFHAWTRNINGRVETLITRKESS